MDEVAILKVKLETLKALLRDNKSIMHWDRELTQADLDLLREIRKE